MAEIVLVVLWGLALLATGPLYRWQWFNPLLGFLSLNMVAFVLYRAGTAVGYFFELSWRAELLYAASFVLFFLGAATVAMATRDTIPRAGTGDPLRVEWSERRWRVFYALVKLLVATWIAGVGYKFWLLIEAYGDPLAMLKVIRQDLIDIQFSFPLAVSYVTLVGNLAVLNLGVLFGFGKFRRGVMILIGISCATMIMDDLTTGARGGFKLFVMLVFSILATFAIRGVRVRWRHVAIGAGAAAGFLLVLGVVVLLRTGGEATLVQGVVISSIYGNITGNIPAFSYFIKHRPEGPLPGYYVLRGIYVFADQLLDLLFERPFLPPYAYDHYKVELYADVSPDALLHNTANDLTYVYWEGGALGLVLYTYLLGALTAYVFVRAVRGRRIVGAQVLALAMVALVSNMRGIYFSAIGFWITLAMIALQDVALFRWRGGQKGGERLGPGGVGYAARRRPVRRRPGADGGASGMATTASPRD